MKKCYKEADRLLCVEKGCNGNKKAQRKLNSVKQSFQE